MPNGCRFFEYQETIIGGECTGSDYCDVRIFINSSHLINFLRFIFFAILDDTVRIYTEISQAGFL